MNVYFFSRHTASQKMIADLGGTITNQFTGTISNIKRVGNSIEFLELQEKCVTKHLIDVYSIIVAVAPLPLQIEWLNAGLQTLLIPQTTRSFDSSGSVVFSYSGLKRLKSIIIDSERWSGVAPTVEQKHAERSALAL